MTENPPLYHQVAEAIREQIISGKLKFGEQLPSQKKLAEQYRVSLITIKRAILELVKDGLLHGQPGKGVFVGKISHNILASQQIKGESIGAIVTDLTSPFYSSVLTAVELEAARNNYFVIFSNTDRMVPNESQQIERLKGIGVRGFVVASRQHNEGILPHIQHLIGEGVPVVFVSFVPDKEVNYIGTDHRMGGYLAAEHLIRLGYKRLAYVTPEVNNPLSKLRYKGFEEALSDNGMPAGEDLIVYLKGVEPGNRFEIGYRLGRQLLAEKDLPEALFAYSDLLALGMKKAFLEAGMRIPHDIALVGFDDIPMAEQSVIPLTTIHQPVEQIGRLAFNTLLQKIDGDTSVTRISLMPQLIVRESCGAAAKKMKQ